MFARKQIAQVRGLTVIKASQKQVTKIDGKAQAI